MKQKNILFVAYGISPFKVTQGASQRSNLLLQACVRVGNVDVVSFCGPDESASQKYSIVFQEQHFYYDKESRKDKFKRLLPPWDLESIYGIDNHCSSVIDGIVAKKQYDLIVVRYVPSAVVCGLLKYNNRLVIDVDDSPVDRIWNEIQYARSLRNALYYVLLSQIMRICMKRLHYSIKCLFYSNPKQALKSHAFYLPNIPYIMTDLPLKGCQNDHIILFIGDLTYRPNIMGVNRFLENVYKKVINYVPNVEFHIVGKYVNQELYHKWSRYRGVKVLGYVPDIRGEYMKCSLSVVPIYHGAGTCIKILESMCMMRPCVTTSFAYSGYDTFFIPGEDCLVANNDNDYAKKVVYLLQNRKIGEKLANNAYIKQQAYFNSNVFNKIVKDSVTIQEPQF